LLEPPQIEAADLRPFDDDQEYIRAERGIKAVFAKAVHGIGLSASSVRSGSKATIAAIAAGNAGMMSSEGASHVRNEPLYRAPARRRGGLQ